MPGSFAGLLRQRELRSASSNRPLRQLLEEDALTSCQDLWLQFDPTPRSCIALCFSHDGRLLASSQCARGTACCSCPPQPRLTARSLHSGDHTVKLAVVQTGAALRTLYGHRRTPWVVRLPVAAAVWPWPCPHPPAASDDACGAGALAPPQQQAPGLWVPGL